MNHPLASTLVLATALAFSAAAPAQTPASQSANEASVPKEFTRGEVRKIDKAGRQVTLKHGEIKNLGMPAMAMVFDVKDAKLLDSLKAGEKVRFKAVHEDGKYVLVDIQRAK